MHTEPKNLEIGLLRLPEVLNLVPVGKSTWWAGVKSGRFPKPVKMGQRISFWRVKDIHELVEKLIEDGAGK